MKLLANHRVLSVDVEVPVAVSLEVVAAMVEGQAAEEGIPGLRGQEVEEPVAAGIREESGDEEKVAVMEGAATAVAAGIREASGEEEKVAEMKGAATAVAASAWVYMGYHSRCT